MLHCFRFEDLNLGRMICTGWIDFSGRPLCFLVLTPVGIRWFRRADWNHHCFSTAVAFDQNAGLGAVRFNGMTAEIAIEIRYHPHCLLVTTTLPVTPPSVKPI